MQRETFERSLCAANFYSLNILTCQYYIPDNILCMEIQPWCQSQINFGN